MKKILILGGYGTFGQRISIALAKAGIATIINGRNAKKAQTLINEIKNQYPNAKIESAIFDIEKELSSQLQQLNPAVVINTCGPFQIKDYSAALSCIEQKIHYIDLADGRDFVTAITTLNNKAKEAGVLVVSGASTVPGLSSAVLDHFKNEFKTINSLIYGIAPGQKAPRGLATTQSILTYLGKPLKSAPKSESGTGAKQDKVTYGWQDIYRQTYPVIGKRWMANCDCPDIDLFAKKYQINSIRFSAGMESSVLHLGIWCLSWLVRLVSFVTPLNLINHASFLLKASHCFDRFGTADGGMHLLLQGIDNQGKEKNIKWFIIAKNGDGPQIPTIPAIILAKKLLAGDLNTVGAMPCVGIVSLDEYLAELQEFDVKVYE